jgi:clan AA aspartic protease
MGKVMTNIRLTNIFDLGKADAGAIPSDSVETVELEALVDTGATMMAIPKDICDRLGFKMGRPRKVRYADGRVAECEVAQGVRVEILGREMTCDALVQPAGTTPLIGQIQLEALDLIVDPKSREARVNPASPDMPLLDLLGFEGRACVAAGAD